MSGHMGWAASAVAGMALWLGVTGAALGQEPAPPEPAADSATVPRSEYDQLRRDMEKMQKRLDAVERQQEAAVEQTRAAVQEDIDRRDAGPFSLTLEDRATANWVRRPGEISPAFRTTQMDLLIGEAENPAIDLYMGLQTAGRFQWLEQDDAFVNNKELEDLDPGFQTAWGDLAFLADIGNGDMLVFFDLYISSRPHPSTTYGNEGYILVHQLPDAEGPTDWLNNTLFKYVSVKMGHFEIDYGDFHYRRSDNAWVQRNPLIGNTIIDPDVEEIGMEIFSKPQLLNWLVGISSGTTTENLNEGRGVASVHGKLWSEITEDLRLSASGYYVDHSDNPVSGPGSTKGSLFSGRRSGGVYGAVLNGGNAPGEVLPGKDQLVTSVQGDLSYTPGRWEFYGNLGWMEDADINGSGPGSPSESWTYGMAEAVYHFTPRVYAAGRYSVALANQVNGTSSQGNVQRVQLGGGYWVTRRMLAKVEGVYQAYNEFDFDDGLVSGVDAVLGPEFYGVIFEVSFAF
jgi:hypothetical protein